jgi:hypothetical protein
MTFKEFVASDKVTINPAWFYFAVVLEIVQLAIIFHLA